MKEWRYIKPLAADSLISDAEERLATILSTPISTLLRNIMEADLLSVYWYHYIARKNDKVLLSFNPTDENILKLNKGVDEISAKLVAFMIDNFGNYICFDKENDTIVFLDFESGETELIDKTFSDFLLKIDS